MKVAVTGKGGVGKTTLSSTLARLYADGKLIDDTFYNGRPFLLGRWRLPADVTELELRILPLQKDMPIYFPREADKTPGEEVLSIHITPKPL